MGDRVLFQVINRKTREYSPVVYGHWSGEDAKTVCERLKARMEDRPCDVDYTAARLVQELIGNSKGSTGFGIWNAPLLDNGKARELHQGDSHGDAGVVLINVSERDMKFEFVGGYLR